MTLTCDDCLSLSHKLAPETVGKLDIIRHHEPTLGPPPPGVAAWCVHGRHLTLRNELRRLGRWRGSWVSTIVFVDSPSVPHLVHELAHVLPSRPPIVDDGEPTAEQRSDQVAQLTRWASRVDEAAQLPWHGHGIAFTRRAIHLAFRAARLGIDVDQNALNVGGDRYQLSHVYEYMTRFASEPTMSTHKTFNEINQLPFPAPVLRLFGDDCRVWGITSLLRGTND